MNGIYGLLGEKLGHSFSPQIHKMIGDYDYRLFEISKNMLENFLRDKNFDGVNVTIPYKKDVIKYLDEISDEAKKIGSVNVIVNRNGKLYGDNTDYMGFMYMVKKSNVAVKNKKCLVLGSGGASNAIKVALSKMGAGEIVTISRSGENNYNNIEKHLDAKIIVNTTPVGMYPNNYDSPLSIEKFKNLDGVFDIVYNPLITKLCFDAKQMGIPYANGLSMLVAQAVKTSEIFFNDHKNSLIYNSIEKAIEKDIQNIVLIGMPSSGKSSVGKAIAKALNKKFVDMDDEIQKKYGMSPAQIILSKGEKYFRELEKNCAKEIGMKNGLVIATGGGVVTRSENLFSLMQNGVIVFLDRDLNKLTSENRPLSAQKGIEKLYKERIEFYNAFAQITVDGNGTIETVTDNIIENL